MRVICTLLFLVMTGAGSSRAESGGRVSYVGGTLDALNVGGRGSLLTVNEQVLTVKLGDWEIEVPYDRINLVEYGQNASRRIVMAVVINPLCLLAKSRRHFLTIGFRTQTTGSKPWVSASTRIRFDQCWSASKPGLVCASCIRTTKPGRRVRDDRHTHHRAPVERAGRARAGPQVIG